MRSCAGLAVHRCVDARRNLQVSLEHIDALGGERGGLLRVSDDDANRNMLLAEQARRF